MKYYIFSLWMLLIATTFTSCDSDDQTALASATDLTLAFNNTFKGSTIILGQPHDAKASQHVSSLGQVHQFSELKYVISNIRLVDDKGQEYAYYVDNLDKGAFIIDQSNPQSLIVKLLDVPVKKYETLKFGFGIPTSLNTLDQQRFPGFYSLAEHNDTQMMWEWGTGYRFTKIEGFYDSDYKQLSIHTGSTLEENGAEMVQGIDAYREITLSLKEISTEIGALDVLQVQADFDFLLSHATSPILLSSEPGGGLNATPNVHSALQMQRFVNNMAGLPQEVGPGMFSLHQENELQK